MTLPLQISQRIDSLLPSLGGYKGLSNFKTDNSLGDIALFNGYTAVITSFTDADTLPIPLIDLQLYGYVPKATLTILDSNFNVKYKEIIQPTQIEGVDTYIFGNSAASTQLINTAKHADLYYLYFIASTAPVLIQLLVSKEVNSIDKQNILEGWSEIVNSRQQVSYLNELFVLPTGNYSTRVYSYESTAKAIDVDTIKYSVATVITESMSALYITPDKDTWIYLDVYAPTELSQPLAQLLGSQESVYSVTLGNLGFVKKTPNVWASSTQELLLSVEESMLYDLKLGNVSRLRLSSTANLALKEYITGSSYYYKLTVGKVNVNGSLQRKFSFTKAEGFRITANSQMLS